MSDSGGRTRSTLPVPTSDRGADEDHLAKLFGFTVWAVLCFAQAAWVAVIVWFLLWLP